MVITREQQKRNHNPETNGQKEANTGNGQAVPMVDIVEDGTDNDPLNVFETDVQGDGQSAEDLGGQNQNVAMSEIVKLFKKMEQDQERRFKGMEDRMMSEIEKKFETLSNHDPEDFAPFPHSQSLIGHGGNRKDGGGGKYANRGGFGRNSRANYAEPRFNGQFGASSSQNFNGQYGAHSSQNHGNNDEVVGALRDLVLGMEKRTDELIKTNQNQNFAQLSATLKDLAGNEGRSQLLNYFTNLESITEGWNNQRRAQLLAIHLVGQSKIIFDGLSATERTDYRGIKNAILKSAGGIGSMRHSAQARLQAGVKPDRGENLREFGVRVLALVRDSVLPCVPDAAIEDIARSHFLQGVMNTQIRNALTIIQDTITYHCLIDKAEELRESMAIQFSMQNQNNLKNNFVGNPAQKTNWPDSKATGSNGIPLGVNRGNFMSNKQQFPQQRLAGVPLRRAPNVQALTHQQHGINLGNESEEMGDTEQEQSLQWDDDIAYLGVNLDQKNVEYLTPIGNKDNGLEFVHNFAEIARPKGPLCTVEISVGPEKTMALIDSGATINVISEDLVKKFMKNTDLGMHPPVFPHSKLADAKRMEFVAGITLPVSIDENHGSWVEFQVAKIVSFPLILGTASLSRLGFKLMNPMDGKDLLNGEMSREPDASVICATCCTISLYGRKIVEVVADVTEGDYLVETNHETMLTTFNNGKAKIMLKDDDEGPEIIVPNKVIGVAVIGYGMSKAENEDGVYCCLEMVEPAEKENGTKIMEIMGKLKISKEINDTQMEAIKGLVRDFCACFALEDGELGQTDLVEHKIELLEEKVVKAPTRPVPFAYRELVNGMLEDYLKRGVIRHSKSPYSAPIVLAKKKDGTIRMCVDYRLLNSITIKDAYPIPNIDTTLLSFGDRKFFSTFDLLSGYWQVKMERKSMDKTAFSVLNGHYEFTVMPFGLTNAPATFERLMEFIFDGLIGDFVFVYLDDILVASKSWDDHLAHLQAVFERIQRSGLKLKPSKCELVAKEIEFLGHVLTPNGLKMNERKVVAIKNFPVPKKVKELQSFLGMAGYYRKFIKDFASVARPLYAIMKKEKFEWDGKCQEAFEELIGKLSEDVLLTFPDFEAAMKDKNRAFIIQTDASRLGIGGILGQLDGSGKARPIYFASRICKPAEKNYGITELEALALRFAVKKFAPFIVGIRTVVETDHSALIPMFTNPKECGSNRINKWAMELMSRYDLVLKYKPGKSNANADALSRAFDGNNEVVPIINLVEPNLPENNMVDEWRAAQMESEYGGIFKYMESKIRPTNLNEMEFIRENVSKFSIKNQLLYYIGENGKLRLMVPDKFREKLFEEKHAGTFGIHACAAKLYEQMKKEYAWKGMKADLKKWVLACPVCACTRQPRKNTPPLCPILSNYPFDLVCMDILQLGLTTHGNKYALVCIDHFSKLLIAEPLRTKSAEEVARVLVERVFLVFGPPTRIHSDKGTEFVNSIIKQTCTILKMGQSTTSGYNPRANGVTERVNRDIISMLRRSCVVPQEWDCRLPFVVFAHNLQTHSSTGESPFYIIFGKDPSVPSEIDPKIRPTGNMIDIVGYKELMAENWAQTIENARMELEKAAEKFKKYYDREKKVIEGKFHVGDRVMKIDPREKKSPNKKLLFKFEGPFRVKKIMEGKALITPIFRIGLQEEWVPLDRLSLVPVECTNFYMKGGRPPQIMPSTSNNNNNYALHLNMIIPSPVPPVLNPVPDIRPNKIIHTEMVIEKIDDWISTSKKLQQFSLFDEPLGPLTKCTPGKGQHDRCRRIVVADVLPYKKLVDGAKEVFVPTLAGQIKLHTLDDNTPVERVEAVVNGNAQVIVTPSLVEQVVSECHRRLLNCRVCANRMRDIYIVGVPLRCIGDYGNLVKVELKGDTIIHREGFGDKLGPAWEAAYLRYANVIDCTFTNATFIGWFPDVVKIESCSTLAANKFTKLEELIQSIRRMAQSGLNQAMVIFLPNGTTTAALNELLEVLKSRPHITTYIVPPPPVLGKTYDEVVDILMANNLNLTFRGRTILSLGWTGKSLNNFHAVEGEWTQSGLAAISRFLRDCIGLKWAFPSASEKSLGQAVLRPPQLPIRPPHHRSRSPIRHQVAAEHPPGPIQPIPSPPQDHRLPARPHISRRVTVEPSRRPVEPSGHPSSSHSSRRHSDHRGHHREDSRGRK